MQSPSTTPRFVFWIPAILVAILISIFSTHYFTGEQTGRVIIPILHWFFPHALPRTLHLMHVGIRKLAHVIEFGAFSISLFHGIRGPRHGWRWSWALATLFLAVAYAGLDEWHQSFVPLREPRVRDVAIDSLGALLAQGLVWLYARWKWRIAASPDYPADAAKK
jgi:VanZ family protein